MSQFRPAKRRAEVSIGESVRIIRELQGLSQNELARLSGIPQATLSAIENDRVGWVLSAPRFLPGHCVAIRQFLFFPAGSYRLKLRPNLSLNPDASPAALTRRPLGPN